MIMWSRITDSKTLCYRISVCGQR